MYYNNNIPYYRYNMYNRRYNPRPNNPNNRFGGFVFPFALGFLSAPLLLRPNYYPYYPYHPVYY